MEHQVQLSTSKLLTELNIGSWITRIQDTP